MRHKGILIFFCGKMGAGKSTKSREVAQERNAVHLSEDEWLSSLYPNKISSFDDYIKFSGQLKAFIKPHIQNILSTGTNVVMDFPANTIKQRSWFIVLATEVSAPHEMIYLQLSDELCLKQIGIRRATHPERAVFDTEDVFLHVTSFFEEPNTGEGLNIHKVVRHP